MSPRLVLSLWRERWGNVPGSDRERPYLKGRLTRWGGRLSHSNAWSLPGMTLLVLLGGLAIYIMLMTARFSLGGQVAFSTLFVGLALYLRRYAGTWVTLILLGMAVIVSTRYLYWRVTETLGYDFNLDFVLGVGLWAAEAYLFLLILLRIVQMVWPLIRAPVPLPTDITVWPTVDVFIASEGQTESAIKQTLLAALALDWPKEKIKIYILDATPRDPLHALVDAMGAVYLVPEGAVDGPSELINFALSETKGDLILIPDGSDMHDSGMLKTLCGWFVRDQRLGMLQTPHHSLAPTPSAQNLALCLAPDVPGHGAFALFRRAALIDIGGVKPGPVTEQDHTALHLQDDGYGHAYLGYSETKTEQNAPSTLAWFRVGAPFLGKTLRVKQHLAALHAMVQFYYLVPRFIFYTAPLAYLLAGIHLVQTTPEFLVAYGVPYLLMVHFVQARLRCESRIPTWIDLRESLLAWYLLIPTTLTLLRTELGRIVGTVKVDSSAPFDRLGVVFYGLVALLNLGGLCVGIVRLVFLQGAAFDVAALYLLWSVGNLMLLAALLAVAEETRHIHLQKRRLQEMPAMLQLSSGRTLACMTHNFPQSALSLKLPVPLQVDAGVAINLSIFRGHDEFTFPARVVSQHNGMLSLRIGDAAKDDYQLFGAATLSRGSDWPLWLPARDANHPLPSWLTRPSLAAWDKLKAAAWALDKFVNWSRLGHWIGK